MSSGERAVAPASGKVCTVCREDCSTRERTKDKQGRYTCKACLDAHKQRVESARVQAQAAGATPGQVVVKPEAARSLTDRAPAAKPTAKPQAKPTPAAPIEVAEPNDEQAFAALFAGEASKLGEPCEGCGSPMDKAAVVCMRCGFNRQTGASTSVRVHSAPKPNKLARAIEGTAGSIGAAGAAIGDGPAAYVFAAIGSVIGGAIGAGIWAGLAYGANIHIWVVAVLIGVLVGVGAALGARNRVGLFSGAVAVMVTICSILAGDYIAARLVVDDALKKFGMASRLMITDQLMVTDIAVEVAKEREAAGIKDQWPDGMDLESASEPEEFPNAVWAKAQSRFDAMPADVREAERARMQAIADHGMSQMKEEVTSAVFKDMATMTGDLNDRPAIAVRGMLWKVIFSVVAVGVSFSIGSGWAGVKEALGME